MSSVVRKGIAVILSIFAGCGALHGEGLQVDLPAIDGLPIVTPSTAASFRLTISNKGKSPISGNFSARLIPPSGAPVEVLDLAALTLAPGETRELPHSLVGKEMGVWTGSCQFTSGEAGGKPENSKALRFAYFEPAGPNDTHPEFMFGIVAHCERVSEPDRKQQMEAAALIGCKVMRTNPTWGNIQRSVDEWNWAMMDEMVATAQRLHMEIQALLGYTPYWAASVAVAKGDARAVRGTPPELTAWRKYVSTFADRYKGKVRLWEPWNEPDIGFWRGTTAQYIELASIALEEIHKVDPANRVLSGGFATMKDHAGHQANPGLQKQVMETLGTRFDYHAVHEHGPFPNFAKVVDGPIATLRASLATPVPPLFFNETAMHLVGSTEQKQAEVLVKKASFARSRGAAGYLWYDLRDDGTNPNDSEHNFGLLTFDMAPKAVYVAFNTFARLVVPQPYLKQLDAGYDHWFFLFGNDQSKMLLFWNDNPATQGENILLRIPNATQARLIDLNGNAQSLPVTNGLLSVSSTAEPHYLVADGAQTIESAGRLVGASHAFFGVPGERLDVSCEFFNPGTETVQVQVKWETPPGMQVVTPASEKVTVPAGQTMLSTIGVKLLPGKQQRVGDFSSKLRISYDYKGMPWNGTVVIPVSYGTLLITSSDPTRDPDLVLDQDKQLVSFVENDPNTQALQWKGVQDLSAKVWLNVVDDFLEVRVAVTDDKHAQTNSPVDLWRGDSVQLAFVVPGQKGSWEFGLAEDQAGRPLTHISSAPVELGAGVSVDLTVEQRGEGRIYVARIPRLKMGLTDKVLRGGFRFDIAVNDNDGTIRTHALQLVPGIVTGKSTEAFPYIVFKKIPVKTAPQK